MKPNHDDLEHLFRTAFGDRRLVPFHEWSARYGEELAQLRVAQSPIISNRRFQIMKWSTIAATLVAASLALGVLLPAGTSERAFALALNLAANAKTFSAKETVTYDHGGRQEIWQEQVYFKEPNLERHEVIRDGKVVEVTITDYDKRQRLQLDPEGKTAILADMNTTFEVDEETGKLKPIQLDTSLREWLISQQARAVEDCGQVQLDGQPVRLMQSKKNDKVIKVWTDPESGHPVRLAFELPKEQTILSSIKINERLSDALFSLDPPQGYKSDSNRMPTPRVGRLFATIKYLILQCWNYSSDHGGRFPARLADLDIEENILKELVSNLDVELEYVRPDLNDDLAKTIVLYEAHDKWPDRGIVAGFADGHAEHINDESRFNELLRAKK